MKVLIVGLNYAPERVGIAVYTTGLAEALAAAGHTVRVVAGNPYYPGWKAMGGHSAWRGSRRDENSVSVHRVPHYIPARPSGARRLLHHLSFALSALLPAIGGARQLRPDLVIAIAPSLIAAPVARLAARIGGGRSWLHVQDFEVEAAFATGLLRDRGWLAGQARNFESKMLSRFDRLSAISPQMTRKLAAKGVSPRRIVEFRNWAEISHIAPLTGPSPYRGLWEIATPHVALYSGNIANKQGVEIIIDAARTLSHRRDLTFIVCGEGPNRAALEARAGGLGNIRFHDLQPAERLNDLLGLASLHLLPQLAGVADLVLPSKLGNMLASGRPVVATAAPGSGLAEEVEGCGIVVPPGDIGAFAAAIERLLDDQQLRAGAGAEARHRALARWDKGAILMEIERALRRATGAT